MCNWKIYFSFIVRKIEQLNQEKKIVMLGLGIINLQLEKFQILVIFAKARQESLSKQDSYYLAIR